MGQWGVSCCTSGTKAELREVISELSTQQPVNSAVAVLSPMDPQGTLLLPCVPHPHRYPERDQLLSARCSEVRLRMLCKLLVK